MLKINGKPVSIIENWFQNNKTSYRIIRLLDKTILHGFLPIATTQ